MYGKNALPLLKPNDMRNILIYTLAIFLHGCITETDNCGYTPLLVGARHVLKVPIQIVPNRSVYYTGDTISIVVDMNDSVHDLNTELNFKIKNFPFKPVIDLYNFDPQGVYLRRGFGSHEISIDSIYKPIYQTAIGTTTSYRDGRYRFEVKMVLKTKGKYVFFMEDLHEINSGGGNPKYLNTYADTVTFEGKCPDWRYRIHNMIEGDDHMYEFEKELVYIDKELNFDNFASLKYPNSSKSPYGSGVFKFERIGTYCFEVK